VKLSFPEGRRFTRSKQLFEAAKKVIPSGVNSTARSTFSGWEPYPLFVDYGDGPYIFDVDGNQYVDYLLGLGPMLFGHRPKAITDAVVKFIQERGTIFALPTKEESELAKKIIAAVPSVERVHLCNTGTEAVLYALRIARAYTGRPKIIRFEGMYHGFSDAIYWSKHPPLDLAGPDTQPVPVPQGPGLPPGLENSIIVLPWNDCEILEKVLKAHGNEIAAVITEPVMLNTGCILPKPGYLQKMRELTKELDIVLIFDEVITGFRLSLSGAQGVYGVDPDLTVFAKGLGGGFPVAALGGKYELMRLVDQGIVSMAGTYCANGIAVAAANAALDLLMQPGAYDNLFQISTMLQEGLQRIFDQKGLHAQVVGIGPVFQVWFSTHPIENYRDAVRYTNTHTFRIWWEEMLVRGVLFHPGPFENLFISFAHSLTEIDKTLEAAESAVDAVIKRMHIQD
jgi:glutamate-1-semialdehyde 2,1-aminomutase